MSGAVEDSICLERMEGAEKNIQVMFTQIQRDISDIKRDLRDIRDRADGYVSRDEFRDKCREIEGLKTFMWKVIGGLITIQALAVLAIKFVTK